MFHVKYSNDDGSIDDDYAVVYKVLQRLRSKREHIHTSHAKLYWRGVPILAVSDVRQMEKAIDDYYEKEV